MRQSEIDMKISCGVASPPVHGFMGAQAIDGNAMQTEPGRLHIQLHGTSHYLIECCLSGLQNQKTLSRTLQHLNRKNPLDRLRKNHPENAHISLL